MEIVKKTHSCLYKPDPATTFTYLYSVLYATTKFHFTITHKQRFGQLNHSSTVLLCAQTCTACNTAGLLQLLLANTVMVTIQVMMFVLYVYIPRARVFRSLVLSRG